MFVLARDSGSEEWSLTKVAEAAKEGSIERIVVMSNTDELRITLEDGTTVHSSKDTGDTALAQLSMLGVTSDELAAIEWEAGADDDWATVFTALGTLLPFVAFVAVVYIVIRKAVKIQPPSSE